MKKLWDFVKLTTYHFMNIVEEVADAVAVAFYFVALGLVGLLFFFLYLIFIPVIIIVYLVAVLISKRNPRYEE